MAHRTKHFTLQIPYESDHGEPDEEYMAELFNNMLVTYKEFGHINYDTVDELVEAELDYMDRHNARVFKCYGSKYLEEWRKSIDNFCTGYKTYSEAVDAQKQANEMRYAYEKAMSCPVMWVTPRVVEDSDGTFKITLNVKYDTSD